ncbi:MAG: hypothetical protein RI826_09940 [Chlorobium phaeovibrioides]|nr:hypothetical protein [Chlorobium phaeovibrioides]
MTAPRVRSDSAQLVPYLLVMTGSRKAIRRLMVPPGGPPFEVDSKEATRLLKGNKRSAPALAGRWRWTATEAAGTVALAGVRKAGPLTVEVSGQLTQGTKGWRSSSWRWSTTRKAGRKGDPADTSSGTAPSFASAVHAAYRAALELEGAVCAGRALTSGSKKTQAWRNAQKELAALNGRAKRAESGSARLKPATKKRPDVADLQPARTSSPKKSKKAAAQSSLFGR